MFEGYSIIQEQFIIFFCVKHLSSGCKRWVIWTDLFSTFCPQLSVRRKNAKEMFGGFFKNMVKSADEVLISGIKVGSSLTVSKNIWITLNFPNRRVCVFLGQEVDEFFEQEKTFLLDYYSKIKDSTAKAEKMTRSHKSTCILPFFFLGKIN